jgi:hypothetical protein
LSPLYGKVSPDSYQIAPGGGLINKILNAVVLAGYEAVSAPPKKKLDITGSALYTLSVQLTPHI